MTKYCKKIYSDLPFAHRQHHHDGHCSRIHGHSWTFEFDFAAEDLDESGFVLDFGSLKWLKHYIDKHFDHTLVLNYDDPKLEEIDYLGISNITIVSSCSSEGIAEHLIRIAAPYIQRLTDSRARLLSVTVHEDSKNSAQIFNDE